MKPFHHAFVRFMRGRRSAMIAIYFAFASLFFAVWGGEFVANLKAPTWLIAPIMAFGSFVAGATFLGGGSIAFPALTKILAVDPVTAKTFSLAIQSVGMSSASLYIISRIKNLPFTFILLYFLGAVLGLFVSLSHFEKIIPSIDLRISFSVFLLCFLSVYMLTRHSDNQSTNTHLEKTHRDILLTFFCGIAGGLVSGLLGSGADLVGFSLLALYFRIEIKRATQISVILMALTSIAGTVMQGLIFDRLDERVLSLWFIAAPVVLIGAPLGAAFCRRISPGFLLIFIVLIVAAEVASTLILIPIDPDRLLYYSAACLVSVLLLLFFKHQAKLKHS